MNQQTRPDVSPADHGRLGSSCSLVSRQRTQIQSFLPRVDGNHLRIWTINSARFRPRFSTGTRTPKTGEVAAGKKAG